MRHALVVAGLLALAGCRGCAGAEPPDAYAISRISDPYAGLAPHGGIPNADRAQAVLERVGDALGYKNVPAQVLAAHAKEPWAGRVVLLVAHGGTKQLEAAWVDLRLSVLDSNSLPNAVKVPVRQAEARIYDLEREGADEETLRHAYLAEIAWTLVLLGPVLGADAGAAK